MGCAATHTEPRNAARTADTSLATCIAKELLDLPFRFRPLGHLFHIDCVVLNVAPLVAAATPSLRIAFNAP